MSINFNYNYPQVAREAGFRLRQYKDCPIDWRIIGSLETDRVLQDQRLEQIDAVLAHLAETPLASILDTNILDSGIVKYFVISQFAVQYLLFCRKFLDETVRDLREAHAESQLEVAKLRKSLSEANNEILSLHKKITQIEAIHEVVYPCHLCSKSFISNEALNIHISRRHASKLGRPLSTSSPINGVAVATDRRLETAMSGSVVGAKQREYHDINLINTIKLELEIKQLKERLNNAERKILERTANNGQWRTSGDAERECDRENARKSDSESKTRLIADNNHDRDNEHVCQHEHVCKHEHFCEHEPKRNHAKDQDFKQPSTPPVEAPVSVAVQSEILETKETDDAAILVDSEELRERKEQLVTLQQRIQDFEQWRAAQQTHNEDSIAEINKKLSEIVQSLEDTKTRAPPCDNSAAMPKDDEPLQRHMLPNTEELERLLSQKVLEIGQKNAEKFEELVNHMEANYKAKLQILEREIRQRNSAQHTIQSSATESEDSADNRTLKRGPSQQAQSNNDTFIVKSATERKGPAPPPRTRTLPVASKQIEKTNKADSLSLDSNRTFVKNEEHHTEGKDLDNKMHKIASQNDSTDITDSLGSESDSTVSSNRTKTEQTQSEQETPASSRKTVRKSTKETRKKQRAPLTPPKPCTRKDAQRIVDKYFIVHGIEARSKTMSTATMKRLHSELTERRLTLNKEQPTFNTTRNKIKKFVEKLCSTKLPKPVAAMLKTTAPLQPIVNFRAEQRLQEKQYSPSDLKNVGASEVTSTSLQTTQNTPDQSDNFKQRLERILSSPMRRPDASTADVSTAAEVHETTGRPAPIPLARKRVMFSTNNATNSESIGTTGAIT